MRKDGPTIWALERGRFDEIDVVGEDISDVDFGFEVGVTFAARVGHLTWFGPLKGLQKLFFHTPMVYLFILGSFLYHDYYWFPVKGKPHRPRMDEDAVGSAF